MKEFVEIIKAFKVGSSWFLSSVDAGKCHSKSGLALESWDVAVFNKHLGNHSWTDYRPILKESILLLTIDDPRKRALEKLTEEERAALGIKDE